MNLPMVKIDGVPDRNDILPGMAHFPATGPAGKFCANCKYRGFHRKSRNQTYSERLKEFVNKTYRYNGCAMFKKLTGRYGPAVKKEYASCRYFEAK